MLKRNMTIIRMWMGVGAVFAVFERTMYPLSSCHGVGHALTNLGGAKKRGRKFCRMTRPR